MYEAEEILKIGTNGRIILSRKVRNDLGLREGDHFFAHIQKIKVQKLSDRGDQKEYDA